MRIFLFFVALLTTSCWLQAQQMTSTLPLRDDVECKQWVDETLLRMTPKEKVGQLLVYSFTPKFDKESQKRLKQLIKATSPGGFLYSDGTVEDRASVTLLARKLSKIPLLITTGMKWGPAMALTDDPVEALMEGNDMVLLRNDMAEAQKNVLKAIAEGEIGMDDITAKCRRILTCKYRLGLVYPPVFSPELVSGLVAVSGAREAADPSSQLTVLGNHFRVLPISSGTGKVAVLSVGGAGVDNLFVNRMAQYTPVERFRLTRSMTDAERREITEGLKKCHRVVISLTMREWETKWYREYLNGLSLPAPVIYACFASYRALYPLEPALYKASAIVLGHSVADDVQRNVADVLFGKAVAQGKLSRPLGQLYAAGEGTEITPAMSAGIVPEDYGMKSYMLHRIDSLVNEGLEAGAYPGCQVMVVKNGKPIYDRCFGTHSDTDKTPVRPSDMYDLASVTKTTATLLAVMKLYDEGKLRLTDKASEYLPYLRNSNKKNITIRDLLYHESGLIPYYRFYRDAIDEHSVTGPFAQGFVDQWHHTQMAEHSYACSDFRFKSGLMSGRKTSTHTLHVAENMWLNTGFKNTILQTIIRSDFEPNRFIYSDLGFILLQQVVEAITRKPMDQYLETVFYEPMGLKQTVFLPLRTHTKTEIIPTAVNDYLRRQDLCGYVHDESAAFMGGVSGNAGLFSNAGEIAQLYQMILNGGQLNGKRYLSEETCRLFTTSVSSVSHRGLGFDKPNHRDPKANACSVSAPLSVYGHTGFTGTCVWVDPDNHLIYVFLSNRVCPHAWNKKLWDMKLLSGIQEIIYQSLK